MSYNFCDRDRREIEAHGLTPDQVAQQLELLGKGSFHYRLNRPGAIRDGIVSIAESDKTDLIARYEREEQKGRMLKFVPASGAASRMFQDWHIAYCEGCSEASEEELFNSIHRYAFYKDLDEIVLRNGLSLLELIERRDLRSILEFILTPRGLNYANLPKALLKFHRYSDRHRTSLEEHLVEAALYVRDRARVARIHFTVSGEHQLLTANFIDTVKGKYEKQFGMTYEIGLSTQMSCTDTIAMGSANQLFRDESGALVFRPGGHGALIANLNALKGDIILIKNIDNVVPDHLKAITVLYKKILGGYLLKLQERIFDFLAFMEKRSVSPQLVEEVVRFCENELHVVFPLAFRSGDLYEKRRILIDRLNRPLRVCGVVKNEGEPGGGPFWVEENDGTQSMQIVESAQVDFGFETQRRIWQEAGYFNPVDLVCAVRDYRGEAFDLSRFVDCRTCLISEKSQSGRALKALEHPGLWNGAMALWNSVFVEVPVETFNPVKTIRDLLRQQHQAESL